MGSSHNIGHDLTGINEVHWAFIQINIFHSVCWLWFHVLTDFKYSVPTRGRLCADLRWPGRSGPCYPPVCCLQGDPNTSYFPHSSTTWYLCLTSHPRISTCSVYVVLWIPDILPRGRRRYYTISSSTLTWKAVRSFVHTQETFYA